MTYPTREHEELLRRALRGVADSVEPADDGLERIRARLKPPRPAIAAWMMSGAEPAALRLRPVLNSFRLRSRLALGAVRPALSKIRAVMAWFRPSDDTPKVHPIWVRPVVTVAAFVVIIASGAFAINELQHTITQAGTTTGNSQTADPFVSSGGEGLHSQAQEILPPAPPGGPPQRIWPMRSPQPSLASPAPTLAGSPSPSCSPSVAPTRTPTPVSSPTPTPTATTPPQSPTPTPTETGGSPSPTSPSPTDSLTTVASSAPSTISYVSYATSAPSADSASAPTASPPPVTPGTRPC